MEATYTQKPEWMKPKDAWDALSMKEKAAMMEVAVKHGITNLKEIRNQYNEFAEGGDTKEDTWTMQDEADYRQWREALPDNLKYTDDDLYDMRGAYKAGMQPTLESDGLYHLASRDPETGRILKAPYHSTYLQAINTDARMGYYPTVDSKGRTYTNTWEGNKYRMGGPLVEYAMKQEYGEENIYGWGDFLNGIRQGVRKARQKVRELGLDKTPIQHLLDKLASKEEPPTQTADAELTYRNRPAGKKTLIISDKGRTVSDTPKRLNHNTSGTREASENLEKQMMAAIVQHQTLFGGSDPSFDIPYIPEKAIILNGSTTSTNVLDSLAKYAGIHNRDPQLSEFPIRKRSSYSTPRKISLDEMLGLSTRETKNGAMPYLNYKNGDPEYNKALGNSNYLTAYGYIPADNLVRNYQYNYAGVSRDAPPLLDAFRYYAQGDYNTNASSHTRDVVKEGKLAWQNPDVQKWWELSGKYWYNTGEGPKE